MLSLGVRAHDFGKLPAATLARAIASHGLTCIQLALAKAIEGINSDTGALSPGLATHLRDAFARHGVRIAVLGCYVNIVHPDLTKRAKLLTRFKEHVRFARDFGCSIVATETASLNADWSAHPDNNSEAAFNEAIRSIAELVAEAETFGVFVAIEGVAHHVMSTPRHLRRMLDTLQSSHLQILFDPVNLLNADNHADQDRLLRESFDLFGDRIIVAHAKDFVIEDGRFRSVAAGFGQFNHELFLDLLRQRKSWLDVLLEETTPATLQRSITRLKPPIQD
jgi:sugar phosphate isomerase/epimerase